MLSKSFEAKATLIIELFEEDSLSEDLLSHFDELVNLVESREDFYEFIQLMYSMFSIFGNILEHRDIRSYIEAISGVVTDHDIKLDDSETVWSSMASALYLALGYE